METDTTFTLFKSAFNFVLMVITRNFIVFGFEVNILQAVIFGFLVWLLYYVIKRLVT